MQHFKKDSRILLLFFLLFGATNVDAVPMLSIDLDTNTAGIQSTRTVDLGAVFDISVVYTDDLVTQFDTVIFDINFNSAGSVLSQNGNPVAGNLASTAPLIAADFDGPILEGESVAVHSFPPAPGFATNTGAMALTSLVVPFVTHGLVLDVLSIEFNAVDIGSSSLQLLPEPFGSPILAAFGQSLPVDLQAATINVRPKGIPEPASIFLVAPALLLLGKRLRK